MGAQSLIQRVKQQIQASGWASGIGLDDGAGGLSLQGAINATHEELADPAHPEHEGFDGDDHAWARAKRAIYAQLEGAHPTVWNSQGGRTVDDVLAVLDQAAAAADD